jgi:hypothetical protein
MFKGEKTGKDAEKQYAIYYITLLAEDESHGDN